MSNSSGGTYKKDEGIVAAASSALVAAALASQIEGAEFTSSILAIGAPVAVATMFAPKITGVPYPTVYDVKQIALYVAGTGGVAVGILAIMGQVPLALDAPTLTLVALCGASSMAGIYAGDIWYKSQWSM